MGLLLAVPTIIAFNAIRKRFFGSTMDSEDSGVMFQVKHYFLSLLLKLSQWWQPKRVQNTLPEPNGEIDKIGLVPLQLDRELDNPEIYLQQRNIVDGVCMSGFNSKGDCLIVRLARRSEGKAESFLYLKLADGSKYQLPSLPDTRGYSSDAYNFSCNGLKIQCLSAMNRWRISYNGFLRRVQGENDDSEIVHVKFSFVWLAGSLSYDFQTDFSCDLLAKGLAKDHSLFLFDALGKLKERLDCYEQWGQFSGTISIDSQEEKETYLWGPRTRNRGIMDWQEIKEFLSIYGQMKDGTRFHLGTISISGIVSKLKYGYVILPNHFIHPVESCYFESKLEGEKIPEKIVFDAGGKTYNVYYYQSSDGCDAYYGEKWNISSRLRYTNFNLDEIEGKGFVEVGVRNETEKAPPISQIRPCLVRDEGIKEKYTPCVVDFTEKSCQGSSLSGGKGSSLAMLTKLSASMQNKEETENFTVPKGIVITTVAYRQHLSENPKLSHEISSLTSNRDLKELEQASKTLMNAFTETTLSEKLKTDILKKIQNVFPQGLSEKTFAVRSSAAGEDSDETSAAGQMETFLGIRTIDQIYENIVKCWASQFSLTAINYKRQTGQVLDSDMAVVVQEMVPAEIAGVVFTCDPITGNPGNITITANYGLGESVVSASVEPDTVIVQRSVDNKIVFNSESIGRKDKRIKISNEGGTTEENILEEDSKKCCLKQEDALKIGRVSVLVEQYFGNPRDIEWAIVGDKLYLLQARPITTCNLETDFEIIHELDSALLTDFEYLSKANVGEVMPGAMCPLTITTLNRLMDMSFQYGDQVVCGKQAFAYHPRYIGLIFINTRHTFLNIVDTILKQVSKEDNVMTQGWQWSIFGRVIENSNDMKEIALHRYGEYPSLRKFINLVTTFKDSFYVHKYLDATSKEIANSYLPEDMKFVSSYQLYSIISQMLPKHCKISRVHSDCSGFSSLYNIFILGILADAAGDTINEELFAKFSNLLSNCENVESADVPQSLKNLADTIILSGAKERILKMTPQEATDWLEKEDGQLGAKYREFLRQHGHRCLMEFDLYSLPWGMDAVSLVRNLQAMVRQPNSRATTKRKDNLPASAVDQLGLSLSRRSKFMLKLLVSWARHAVCLREKSKSALIKSVDIFRRAYRRLGRMMSEEGRIPEPDLIFFLTHEEIGDLLKSRSARLISKAIRRKRMHPKLNALRFPEITSGPPQPINTQSVVIENGVSDWVIKATPVSQGKVFGHARVVNSLDEAHTIEPGEILIAYSTDIGWTPYFPMLGGVVTELGGLISHGAVVAREFGLPCIVGAVNATAIVKTGDFVVLDGTAGTLKKTSKAAA